MFLHRTIVAGLALGLAPGLAHADVFGGQIHYLTGSTALNGLELGVAPGVSEPAALSGKRLRLSGDGMRRGGDFRFDVVVDELRVGFGMAYFSLTDVSVASDPLPQAVSLNAASVRGGSFEFFLGRELGQGPVYPYFDVVSSFSVLAAQVETHVAPYGHVGTTEYDAFRFGLGPRIGMLFPVGHSTMIDFALQHRLLGGIEETTFLIGLGYWENDRHDEFSEELRGDSIRGEI